MGIVNSEGEVPSDLAEEPAMKDLLLEQVKKQGNRRDRRGPGDSQTSSLTEKNPFAV